MNNYYGYIYKITHIDSGDIYVGRHKGIFGEDDYFASGLIVSRALEKYGRKAFIRELLCTCQSEDELNLKEAYFIRVFDCVIPNGMNMNYGGNCVSPLSAESQKKRMDSLATYWDSEEGLAMRKFHSERFSKMHLGKKQSDDTKRKRSESFKAFLLTEAGEEYRLNCAKRFSDALTGRKLSDEHRLKISCATRGKVFVNNGIVQHRVSREEVIEYIELGYSLGKLESTGKNISAGLVGRPVSEATRKKLRDSISGRRWCNNGVEQRQVTQDEFDALISSGWVSGMLPRSERQKENIRKSLIGIRDSEETKKMKSES